MNQITTPNFDVKGIRGWCLKYVDDAGNAPERRPTAKAAYYAEKEAGRIDGSIDSPLNVWVVGFLDFTKGQFTVEGHVFFMKNLGNGRYEIRDSEVGSGARKPYGSIAELIGWFGAYSPQYLGWSTHCDGRQYASEGDDEMFTRENYIQLAQAAGFEFGKDFDFNPKNSPDTVAQIVDYNAPKITREMENEVADAITGVKNVIGWDGYNSQFVGQKIVTHSIEMAKFWAKQAGGLERVKSRQEIIDYINKNLK